MEKIIDIFSELGNRLVNFGDDDTSRDIITDAIADNPWFTHKDIVRSVEAIRSEMLDRHKLTEWLSQYPAPTTTPRNVAVIMAGNIPLVGFFDLLCTLCSGHKIYIKPSSKDSVLIGFIIDQLKQIDSSLPIYKYSSTDSYDMVIATGGDDANRYFREHFAHTRTLLRGSRHSIAILRGDENSDEMRALAQDIASYSGLGCRSVSMIFVPREAKLTPPYTEAINTKLARNTAATRAMFTMQRRNFIDCGGFICVYGDEFPTALSLVTIRWYDSIDEVKRWLYENSERVQCIVTHIDDIDNAIPFGKAQYPTLWDYADGVDTMQFLLG